MATALTPEAAAALLRALAEALMVAAAQVSIANRREGVAPPSECQWITPAEAAQRLGVTERWIARRWRSLPFCKPLPGGARGYRICERELQEAMKGR